MARSLEVNKLVDDLDNLRIATGDAKHAALWGAAARAKRTVQVLRLPVPGEAWWDEQDMVSEVMQYTLSQWDNYNPDYPPEVWGAEKAKTAIRNFRRRMRAIKRGSSKLPWDVTEESIKALAENNGWSMAPGCYITQPHDADADYEGFQNDA